MTAASSASIGQWRRIVSLKFVLSVTRAETDGFSSIKTLMSIPSKLRTKAGDYAQENPSQRAALSCNMWGRFSTKTHQLARSELKSTKSQHAHTWCALKMGRSSIQHTTATLHALWTTLVILTVRHENGLAERRHLWVYLRVVIYKKTKSWALIINSTHSKHRSQSAIAAPRSARATWVLPPMTKAMAMSTRQFANFAVTWSRRRSSLSCARVRVTRCSTKRAFKRSIIASNV